VPRLDGPLLPVLLGIVGHEANRTVVGLETDDDLRIWVTASVPNRCFMTSPIQPGMTCSRVTLSPPQKTQRLVAIDRRSDAEGERHVTHRDRVRIGSWAAAVPAFLPAILAEDRQRVGTYYADYYR
jgi:hypothetical protein